MGQKVHPIGFRLAVSKDWQSRWYAPQGDYADQLHADLKVRRYLESRLQKGAVSRSSSSSAPGTASASPSTPPAPDSSSGSAARRSR